MTRSSLINVFVSVGLGWNFEWAIFNDLLMTQVAIRNKMSPQVIQAFIKENVVSRNFGSGEGFRGVGGGSWVGGWKSTYTYAASMI